MTWHLLERLILEEPADVPKESPGEHYFIFGSCFSCLGLLHCSICEDVLVCVWLIGFINILDSKLMFLLQISYVIGLQPVFMLTAISIYTLSSLYTLKWEVSYYNTIFWETAQRFQYSLN